MINNLNSLVKRKKVVAVPEEEGSSSSKRDIEQVDGSIVESGEKKPKVADL